MVDVRGNLPRTPPEEWSVPEMAPDRGSLCSIDAEGMRLIVGLRARGDTGGLFVAMRVHGGHRTADKLAARILRRFRQCSPFTEVEPDEEERARYVTDGMQSATSCGALASTTCSGQAP